MTYDLIVVGAGPAGVAAAIFAARRELRTLLVGRETGGQLMWAGEIENYPGFDSIMASDLVAKFDAQLRAQPLVERVSAEVRSLQQTPDSRLFLVNTDKAEYQGSAVVLAMGLSPKRLAIPGEVELTGKGVSYCVNCDAPLYRDKRVAVVGGGNSALDAAEVLSKIAKEVVLVNNQPKFTGFESLAEELEARPNVSVYNNQQVLAIGGQGRVESLRFADKTTKAVIEKPVEGVFIEIGRVAHTDLVAALTDRDQAMQIVVDDKCRTRTPGLFAAGDVTTVPFKQITTAVGQGTIAALAAYQYLQEQAGKEVKMVMDRSHK